MSRILEGVKVEDLVIVTQRERGPDALMRTVRYIERVTKVFKRVLQTETLISVQISSGEAWGVCSTSVLPASDDDVAEVLREIEERKLADAEYKAKRDAERVADRRRAVLRGEISAALSLRVPEDVLARVLAVLRGEQ